MEEEIVIDEFLENPPTPDSQEKKEAPAQPDEVVEEFLDDPDGEKSKDEEKAEEKEDEGDEGDEGKSKSEKKTQFSFRGFANKAGSAASAAHDQIAALPTPGGIGILVFVLIFFIWAIVPVSSSGQTRLQLLWLTLTGHTVVNQGAVGEAPPEQGPTSGSSPTTNTGATSGTTTGMGDGGLPLFYANPFDFGV